MGNVSKWGTWSGQYTYSVIWNGVPLTVEVEVNQWDEYSLDVVRVLAGEVDITDIVDTTSGHLHELLEAKHVNRHYPDHTTENAIDAALCARLAGA